MTGSGYPEGSQAVTALVVGILGLVLCQVLGPVAWYLGNQEISAIDGGRRAPENRGMAVAARVLGIIGTVFLAIAVVVGIVVLAVVIIAALSETA